MANVYYHAKTHREKRHWECRNLRLSKDCTARAVTNNPRPREELVLIKGPTQSPHSHAPNFNEGEAEKILGKLKRKAEDHPEQPPTQLLWTELANVPEGIYDVQ